MHWINYCTVHMRSRVLLIAIYFQEYEKQEKANKQTENKQRRKEQQRRGCLKCWHLPISSQKASMSYELHVCLLWIGFKEKIDVQMHLHAKIRKIVKTLRRIWRRRMVTWCPWIIICNSCRHHRVQAQEKFITIKEMLWMRRKRN